MAHTYNVTTDRGRVRLRIGDTVDRTGANQSLTDAEIDAALELSSDLDVAALTAARWLLARLRTQVSQNAKGVSSSARERVSNLQELIVELKEVVATSEVDVYCEGISKADNAVHDADTDFTGATFSVGMDDNAYASSVGSENDVD